MTGSPTFPALGRLITGAVLALAALAPAGPALAQQKFMIIGTGGVTGVYHAAGGAVCRLVNKHRTQHGYRCMVESTGGSVSNLQTLQEGDVGFGVVQSDALYHAVKGEKAFSGKPVAHLRSVLSLHPEPLTLVVRKDARIRSLGDLRGKRVAIGNPGSGTRSSVDELMRAAGLKPADFAAVAELKADEHGAALCGNQIDAFFFVVGHPSANIQDPMMVCGAQLVSITGAFVERLVRANAFYTDARIPARTYPSQVAALDTYGVRATLVTTARQSDEEVYVLVKAVFEQLEEFKRLHPALSDLAPATMIQAGLSAPLHPGAGRYYRQRGWMK